MRIDPDNCISCGACEPYCPSGAIKVGSNDGDPSYVADELCFECGVCLRADVCPEDAFVQSEDLAEYPRSVRTFFSDPNTTHKLTLVPGRGTEESKTNDVTGRIKRGEVGLCIEMGRPGIGATFMDIQLMTSRLRALDVEFEACNPLTALMDPHTGAFGDELLSQPVLSAIIELRLYGIEELERVIPAIMEVANDLDTVFSLGCSCRFDANGALPVMEKLAELGIVAAPNAKINLGMGRPLVDA
jgi:NAD-dependent dihydropyrimidine dehydrogenase PreA subunit